MSERVTPSPQPVSFFIPCYNCAAWIEHAIASIIEGNLEPGDEIILVNDGSQDATATLLNHAATRHPGVVRVISHDRNRGGGAARNTAVQNARHELLFCLDSDNLLIPGSVRTLRNHQYTHGCDVVGFQHQRCFRDTPGELTHTRDHAAGPERLEDYLSGQRVLGASGNMLFTRTAWNLAGGYPTAAGALDTWGFGLRLVANGARVEAADAAYLHRHGHESYWVRQTTQHREALGRIAAGLLMPYVGRLRPRDRKRVENPKRNAGLYHELSRKPLRLQHANGTTPPHASSAVRKTLGRWGRRAAFALQWRSEQLSRDADHAPELTAWRDLSGPREMLRYELPLDASSCVVDLGGYQGDFAGEVSARYGCRVWVFEPVPSFARQIAERFSANPRITVTACAVADREARVPVEIDGESSAVGGTTSTTDAAAGLPMIAFDHAMREHQITRVDVLKVNIEGSEYLLLEHLLDTGWIEKIGILQVQFHRWRWNGQTNVRSHDINDLRQQLQRRLSATHDIDYSVPFVWEQWRRRAATQPDAAADATAEVGVDHDYAHAA